MDWVSGSEFRETQTLGLWQTSFLSSIHWVRSLFTKWVTVGQARLRKYPLPSLLVLP